MIPSYNTNKVNMLANNYAAIIPESLLPAHVLQQEHMHNYLSISFFSILFQFHFREFERVTVRKGIPSHSGTLECVRHIIVETIETRIVAASVPPGTFEILCTIATAKVIVLILCGKW